MSLLFLPGISFFRLALLGMALGGWGREADPLPLPNPNSGSSVSEEDTTLVVANIEDLDEFRGKRTPIFSHDKSKESLEGTGDDSGLLRHLSALTLSPKFAPVPIPVECLLVLSGLVPDGRHLGLETREGVETDPCFCGIPLTYK